MIPLGYSAECAISQALNGRCINKSDTELQTTHLQVKQWKHFEDIRIVLTANEEIAQLACGETMFLENKLGLASTTNRPVHLQRLRQYDGESLIYVNLSSQFYSQHCLQVDLIAQLHSSLPKPPTFQEITPNNFRILSLRDSKVYAHMEEQKVDESPIQLDSFFSVK